MTKAIILLLVLLQLIIPASAIELEPPPVPESSRELMPENTDSFLDGLKELFHNAISVVQTELGTTKKICLRIFSAALILSLLQCAGNKFCRSLELIFIAAVSGVLLTDSQSLIPLAADTIQQMNDYGKLLLPVMTAALAAYGGAATSAALYSGTMLFDTILSSLISDAFLPGIYIFLALSIAYSVTGEALLKRLRDLIRSAIVWCLKTLLTIFTTYMSITGVVSGTTDAAALKATKVTISSVVPVVGGILSDASEAVLISAGMVKNAAGIYGLLAILAIFLAPFLEIGIHYLMMKLLSAVCALFSVGRFSSVIEDIASAMGLLLAMTGAVCLMLLISTVCFIKGTG